MKNFILFLLLFCFFILSAFAEDWALIPNTNVSYDKNSTEYDNFGIVRLVTKTPSDDRYETRPKITINCNTQQFKIFEAKLYDTYQQKYVYREFPNSSWENIPQNSNMRYLYNDVCRQ